MWKNIVEFAKKCFQKFGKDVIKDTHENIKNTMIDMKKNAENTLNTQNKQDKNNELDER